MDSLVMYEFQVSGECHAMTCSRKKGFFPILLLVLLLSCAPWVQVARGNEPPVITSVPPTEAWVNKSLRYDVVATDNDSATLTIKIDKFPIGMWVIPTTHSIYWVPNDDELGPNDVVVNVSDGQAFTLQAFTVTVKKNHAPVIGSEPDSNATVDVEYTYQVAASDAEGDALNYSLEESPPGMTIDASGLLSWVPAEGRVGDNYVKLVVRDWQLSAIQEFNVTVVKPVVNVPPVITSPVPPGMVYADQLFHYTVIAKDDNTGDVLTFSLEASPCGMVINPASGKMTWEPKRSDEGSHDITVKVSDGNGGAVYQNFTLQVKVMEIETEPKGMNITPVMATILVLLVAMGCTLILIKPAKKASEEKEETKKDMKKKEDKKGKHGTKGKKMDKKAIGKGPSDQTVPLTK